jgi:hypothetical protein
MFKIVPESHLDHGLRPSHIDLIRERFAGRDAFFIATIQIPSELASVPCGLHGPEMGDEPVADSECTLVVRDGRRGESRLCDRRPRDARSITVIAGPYLGDPCVLFTAYGGPLAPKEPWDAAPHEFEASKAFWAQHALSRQP